MSSSSPHSTAPLPGSPNEQLYEKLANLWKSIAEHSLGYVPNPEDDPKLDDDPEEGAESHGDTHHPRPHGYNPFYSIYQYPNCSYRPYYWNPELANHQYNKWNQSTPPSGSDRGGGGGGGKNTPSSKLNSPLALVALAIAGSAGALVWLLWVFTFWCKKRKKLTAIHKNFATLKCEISTAPEMSAPSDDLEDIDRRSRIQNDLDNLLISYQLWYHDCTWRSFDILLESLLVVVMVTMFALSIASGVSGLIAIIAILGISALMSMLMWAIAYNSAHAKMTLNLMNHVSWMSNVFYHLHLERKRMIPREYHPNASNPSVDNAIPIAKQQQQLNNNNNYYNGVLLYHHSIDNNEPEVEIGPKIPM